MARPSRQKRQPPRPVATTSSCGDVGGSTDKANPAVMLGADVEGGGEAEVGAAGGGGEQLLERLRILLHRLQMTTEILQNWPEARGDSARVHADTCTELITAIRKIALGLRGVERHVNGTGPISTVAVSAATITAGANHQTGDGTGGGDTNVGGSTMSSSTTSTVKEALSSSSSEAFRTYLDTSCPIPLDILDLLDVGSQQNPFGVHPSCYARGLMEESLRQLARLERRRRALRMLAASIEGGMLMNDSLLVNDAATINAAATM